MRRTLVPAAAGLLVSFCLAFTFAQQVCPPGTLGDAVVSTPATRVNAYYAAPDPTLGETVVAAGSLTIPVDVALGPQATNLDPRVPTGIVAGDVLLVIQIQGADIDTNDNHLAAGDYGDGPAGLVQRGAVDNGDYIAGNYEYVTATGAIVAGEIPIAGAGSGGGTLYPYVNSDSVDSTLGTAQQGVRRYQVIKVGQFTNLEVTGSLIPDRWNGRWGGVVALDVADTLTFTGGALDATGRGFRGGQFFPGRSDDDESQTAGNFGFKGEGIAGRPTRLFSRALLGESGSGEENEGFSGYPGVDGGGGGTTAWTRDTGQGAPGNAGSGGGGGEDAGAGGGANGGAGGGGGQGTSGAGSEGQPGAPFPQYGLSAATRLVLGGGGGASNGNDTGALDLTVSSGQAGGGLMIVRAQVIDGLGGGAIRANGDSGGTAPTEGGGGGGAGGSIVLLSNSSTMAGVVLEADGGDGGSSTQDNDGGGGGGGGGVIYVVNTSAATPSVLGGAAGTGSSGGAFDGNPGGAGLSSTITTDGTGFEPFFCEFPDPVIGVAKQMSVSGNGPWTVTIDLYVESFGGPVRNLSMPEDLTAVFGAEGSAWTLTSATLVAGPATIDVNPAFDGESGGDTELIDPSLAALGAAGSGSESAQFRIELQLLQGGSYQNQVTVTGSDSSGRNTSDSSDDGSDPDPDGDGLPDEPGENDPTPLLVSAAQVGVAKRVTATRQLAPTLYELDIELRLENLDASVAAPNVQLSDDLSAAFPAVTSIAIVGTPAIGGLTPPATAFDGVGNNALLAGSDTLVAAAVETISFTVRVDFGTATGPFENQALATSSETPGGTVLSSDLSDDGTDPDPSGDDDPSSDPAACATDPADPACEDTPTDVGARPQVVGVAKALTAARQVRGTIYDFDFSLVVENLGGVAATNVQLVDDLSVTFPGVDSIAIQGTPSIGAFTAPASAYDGVGSIELLSGSDSLAVGTTETIAFTARVDLGSATGPFTNTATVSASATPGGTVLFTDDSDDGTDADPSGDGDPSSDPGACATDPADPACEDTPTAIAIAPQTIGIAKRVAAIRQVAVDRYELDFSLVVENLGDVPATHVQVTDDLAAAFPGVVSIAIVGTPSIGGFSAPATAFDGVGNTELLSGSDDLAVGASETIAFTVAVQLSGGALASENQAVATVSENPGGTVLGTDLSDDGVDPDPSGDDDPSSDPAACASDPADPDCEDTPSAIVLAPQVVGVAKALSAVRQVRGTIYDFDFSLVVENLGAVAATNVQVSDDLSAAFPGVDSIAIQGTPSIGAFTAPASPYDGVGSTELLLGSDGLAVGASETIAFTARVDLGAATGPFANSATVTVSDAPGGTVLFSDLSDAGTDPDPSGDDDPSSNPGLCATDPADPDCEDTPTPIAIDPQRVGIAKQLLATRQLGPDLFEVDFSLFVENLGSVAATNLQVVDDLAAAFPGVTSIAIVGTPAIGGFTAPASAYDGVGSPELLSGSDSLAVGASETIAFTVSVDLGSAAGPFANSATVTSSESPGGTVLSSDLSDDGADPDPGGDGDPSSDPAACASDPADPDCEDTPTAVALERQVVGVAKRVAAVRLAGVDRYEVDFELTVENLGTIAATNVQVVEDLAATFPGVVSVAVLGSPTIGGFTPPSPAFDGVGNNEMISGGDTLALGAIETIAFTVAVQTPPGANSYSNQVTASASGTPGGNALSSDLSDDGVDPDPSGDGDPSSNPAICATDASDPACEDTPTTFVLPPQVIGVAKALTAARQIGATLFEFDFSLVVENLSAGEVATNVQVSDDLAAAFPGVASITIVGTPSIGAFTPPAAAYDGVGNTALLAGSDALAVGASETIAFTARVDLGSATAPFENVALATVADAPGGTVLFSDLSDDGADPDPDGDDDPSSNPGACAADPSDPDCEDTPTAIAADRQRIGVAKQISAIRQVGTDRYELDFSLVVENLGDVPATHVQVTDDLAATFPGVVSIAIVGTPSIGGFSAPVTAFDGVGNTELLSGSDDLAVGASETIAFTVAVQLSGGSLASENQAVATVSESPGGTVLGTDLSDDGVDPDPNGDGDPSSNPGACAPDPTDPDCEDSPTPFTLAPQVIGVAKQLLDLRQVRGTIYDFDFSLVVENLGSIEATNVQLVDDLSAAFPGVTSIAIVGTPSIGNFSAPASAYDGVGSTALLAGSDSLAVGASETVAFSARVDLGSANGPFANSATVSVADLPGGTVLYSDLSDDGADPDPSGDDDPSSNPGACATGPSDPDCEDTPTAIAIAPQTIGIAKRLADIRPLGGTEFEVDFVLVVENLGAVPATHVQVVDDLAAAFPGVTSIALVGAPALGGFSAPATPYDGVGNTALLSGSDTLAVGASETIAFTLRIDVGGAPGPFANTATVTSSETPGGTVLFSDDSDDGSDPDPSGDDDPSSDPGACAADSSDPACEDTPTSVALAPQAIGLAKRVAAIRAIGPGSYEVDIELRLVNLSATAAATNVQVSDDLAAAFPGVTSIALVGTPDVGALTPASPAYDGVTRIDLLAGSDTLAPATSATLGFTVAVDVSASATRSFVNSASALSAAVPGGTVLSSDLSDDGVDADPDGDGNGNSDPAACASDPSDPACEQTPTPILLESPALGLAKAATVDALEVTFDFLVENFGDVDLDDLSVADDLDEAFGAGNYSVTASPTIVADPGGGLVENPNYDGSLDPELLLPGSTLAEGQTAQIRLVVTLVAGGAYFNTATATATSPEGATVSDTSTNGDDPDVDATASDGITVDGGVGANDANDDPADNSEPTPISTLSAQSIVLSKSADRQVVAAAGFVGYTLTVENTTAAPIAGLTLADTAPVGLVYVADSARIVRAGLDGQLQTPDDVSDTLTAAAGRPTIFGPITLAASESVEVRYLARVGAAAVEGLYTNTAQPRIGGIVVGNEASADVRVEADPTFDRTTVIGKVFDDRDGDGVQDPGEPGIAGVRLATVGGLLVETDRHGRYHIADVDGGRFDRGRNFILKIDPATLPEGTVFMTENPRVLRITPGLMSEIDFGVALPDVEIEGGARTVDVSETLNFDENSAELSPAARERLRELADELATAASIDLRITGRTERKAAPAPGEQVVYERKSARFTLTPHFPVLSAELQPADRAEIDGIVEEWRSARDVELFVEGHTSSVRIAPRSRHIYEDNYALSEARARSVADYVMQRLELPAERVHVVGKGPDEPVASNATAEGRAANRRTELEMKGEFPITRTVEVAPEQLEGEGHRPRADLILGQRRADAVADALGGDPGVRTRSVGQSESTVDGGAADRRAELSGSYRVELPVGGVLRVTEDPAVPHTALNVGAPATVPVRDGQPFVPVPFAVYSNYADFIDRYEVVVYETPDRPIARIESDDPGRLSWAGQQRPLEAGRTLHYVLRAYDEQGNFDETRPGTLLLTDADASVDDLMGYDGRDLWGVDRLARRGIAVQASRVRIEGRLARSDQQLTIDGVPILSDREGRFAAERLLPLGRHELDVTISGGGAPDWNESYPVDVSGRYFFMVGIADFTVGSNDSGSIEPISPADRYDGDVYTDGRVAFYLKGKVKGRYLITAQLDTTEEELDTILDSFDEEDPRRIFRNLDPDRYYPVYGDDSTTISDVDTQGRFYVRVDWDRSQALWGNFNTSFTGTEFARFNRSLYGAMVDYDSRPTTEFGDSVRQLDLFGSQAQSVFAHDEFRATGGSLYYLRETEIVQGSEKLWIEVRDRDSERVVELTPLTRGADYEIDEIQGRVLLSRPLSQVAVQAGPNLIVDDPLDGNDVYLVADYEYLPGGFNADDWSYGARGKLWAGSHVALGGTYVEENRAAQDYSLLGADVTFKIGEGSYVKAELADTEASQAGQSFASTDGGLTFSALNGSLTTAPRDGGALGVEARLNLADFGERDGQFAAWWRERDAGFSTARLDTGVETTEFGAEGQWSNDAGLRVSGRAAVVDREAVRRDESYSLQADYDAGRVDVSAELRHVVEESTLSEQSADLAAARVGVDLGSSTNLYGIAQTTIDASDGYADNDRYTLGVRTRAGERLGIRAELSEGDRGEGALAGIDYQATRDVKLSLATTAGGLGDAVQAGADWRLSDRHSLYGTYTLSTDRTEARRGAATVGQRGRISDQLEVFSEGQFIHGDRQAGLAQVYGVDFRPTETVTVGASIQQSDLDMPGGGDIDRDSYSLSAAWRKGRGGVSTRLEYRDDRGALRQTQWLTANRADLRVNPSWTLLAKLNASESEPDATTIASARFIEGAVGFAYRPVADTRWNVIGKLTYLFDLPSVGQSTARTDQEARVFSAEVVRDLGQRWKIGGKLAARQAEIRLDRDQGDWIENDLQLAIVRLRYHLIRDWDGVAEFRSRWSDESADRRDGFLAGLYKHLGEHVKLGVGYNFTDVSDDLTEVDEEAGGWFVNAIGKF